MLATGLVVTGTLAALSIRLMPHPVMRVLGVPCSAGSGCATMLPWWGQWGLWSASILLLAGLLARGAYSAASGTRAMVRTRRFARSVGLSSGEGSWRRNLAAGPFLVLDGPGTFAFTVGLFRPTTVLSTDLIHSLNSQELEAVVAHEGAHAAGRDNLILLAARAVAQSLWFLPGVELAHRCLRRMVELAADSQARAQVGDGLVVASSLHRFASLMSDRSAWTPRGAGPVLAWFSEDGLIGERIGRLLDESDRRVSRVRVRLAFAALAAVLLVFAVGTYRVASVNLDSGSHATVCEHSAPAPIPPS
ncbi:MAG: M56 family metallopeptidase [bacterium]